MITELFGIYIGAKLIESGQKNFEKAEKAGGQLSKDGHIEDGIFKKVTGMLLVGYSTLELIQEMCFSDNEK